MKLIGRTMISIGGALLLLLFGCTTDSATSKTSSQDSPQTSASHTPRFVVIGVDISGSYEDEMIQKAFTICKQLLVQAQPKEIFFIRTISAESYPPIVEWQGKGGSQVRHRNTLLQVRFTEVPAVPNRFNRKARRSYLRQLALFQKQKTQAIQQLDRQIPSLPSAPQTDIYGFLQAASDLFALAPKGYRKGLMFATDLKDTVGFQVQPNLQGVEVTVFEFLAEANPKQAQKRREAWSQKLKEWGAMKVTVQLAY